MDSEAHRRKTSKYRAIRYSMLGSQKPVSPQKEQVVAKETTSQTRAIMSMKSSLLESTKNEMIDNPGMFTCPNHNYIIKKKQKTASIIARAEKFVNPCTHQEVFFTDEGMYVYDEHGCKLSS